MPREGSVFVPPNVTLPPDSLVVEIEGLLVDARAARRTALAHALATSGTSLAHDRLASLADGRSTSDAIAAARAIGAVDFDATDAELATLRADRAFEDAMARGVTLVPGARDAIADLAGHVRVGVVTRMPRAVADAVLSLAELARLLPGRARHPASVVALVDTVAGADAARSAGLRVVGVGRGARDATDVAGWVASAAGLTYDAVMQLLACSGARTP
jgi:beta-phosphoglucomutase-like phosphatase (HAD superfamily)